MLKENSLASDSDILVRAFIAAFVLPVFYATPFAPLLQWHVSVVILFFGLYVAFRLLKLKDRMLVMSGVLIVAANLLPLLVYVFSGTRIEREFAPLYSLALSLLAIIAAFLWPKPDSAEALDEKLKVGDKILLVIGETPGASDDDPMREITIPAHVLEIEEVRVKVRHRDLNGNMIESWSPMDDIRLLEEEARD